MSNQNEQKNETVYEVEIQFSETFLEKNPTIKDMYDNGKWKVPISTAVDEETAKTITDVIGDLNANHLATFNPLLAAINQIAEYKNTVGTVKPEKLEDEDEKVYDKRLKDWVKSESETYKEISGTLRTFNGSATRSKSEIKAPIIAAGKKVDTLFNALKDYSTSVKDQSDINFKPYLDEVKRIADEKEAIKNKETNDKIADLSNQNQAANEKLLAAQAKNSYADTLTSISDYFIGLESRMPGLNISGLQMLQQEMDNYKFDFSHIAPMEQIHLEKMETSFRSGTKLKIENAIKDASNPVETVQNFQHEMQPAPTGFSYTPIPANTAPVEDNPFEAPVTDQQVAQFDQTEQSPMTDAQRFNNMILNLSNAYNGITQIDTNFDDQRLKGMGDKLKIQFETLAKNTKVLFDFARGKKEQFDKL